LKTGSKEVCINIIYKKNLIRKDAFFINLIKLKVIFMQKILFYCSLLLLSLQSIFPLKADLPDTKLPIEGLHHPIIREIRAKIALKRLKKSLDKEFISNANIYTTFTGPIDAGNSLLLFNTFSETTSDYVFSYPTGNLTVSESGLYQVTFGVSSTNSTTIAITVNGEIIASAPPIYVDGSNSQSMSSACFTVTLSAKDTLTLTCRGNINLISNATAASAFLQVLKVD
jgi:hypothetical protein